MPSSWFGKNDDVVDRAGGDPKEDFQQLADDLKHLEKLLGNASQRAAAYLVEQRSQSAEADRAVTDSLSDKIAAMAGKLDALERQVTDGFEKLLNVTGSREEPAAQAASPRGGADWHRAILGPDLADRPDLAFKCRQLLDGVLDGDPGARALAGQLLVFQSAPPDRLPKLLKEIGEAYYRWQPKTAAAANPLEEALVRWLEKTCDAAGISNTIELVHPGERFDATRHNAASRGVEITEAHGWIVLRDNGKVYTKAGVAVK